MGLRTRISRPRLPLDALALPSTDRRGDPDCLCVAVDAFEVVHVVHANLLEAGRMLAAGRGRRAVARLDRGALALDAATLFREPPRGDATTWARFFLW